MTALRQKHGHNYITQLKTSRRIMAASAENIPQLIQTINTSHTQCVTCIAKPWNKVHKKRKC